MASKKVRDLPEDKIPRRSVLSDDVYELIKRMIFDHEIAPGNKVNIDAIALKLEVSQTPVREALASLESDGLIEKEPQKGYRATQLLSIKELKDIYQFRLLIEPWAAEQAAKNIDKITKAALKAELQSAKTAIKFADQNRVEALTEHDTRFHTLIANISGNTSWADSFERTHCHLHLYRLYMAGKLKQIEGDSRSEIVLNLFEHYYQSNTAHLAFKEHELIVKAIIEENPKAARRAMHAHIESSLKRLTSRQ